MSIFKNQFVFIFSFLLPSIFSIAIVSCNPVPDKEIEETRPNILLIVADDLGYTDLGAFGGEISTPNIDKLAQQGMLLTNFHTAPLCAPTRAMLLSGNDNHIAGMGSQSADSALSRNWGYEKHLSDRIIPLPQLMQDAGYHTYTVGKWHLGTAEENSPKAKGFERSWNLLGGAGNHYNSVGLSVRGSLYRRNGELVEYPKGRYSTEFYTSTLIDFIKQDKDDDAPFFAFAAYTSPHWPLQAPKEFIQKYKGKYDSGYDELRQRRFESVKSKGIIPEDAKLPPRLEEVRHWDALTVEDKRREAKKMELYAAMVDNLDFHVGRLIDSLKAFGLYENTLIIFMSDNGADGGDFYNNSRNSEFLHKAYQNTYESMGSDSSFVVYGTPWAHAGMAPFNRYKTFTTEGGIRSPLLIAGPLVKETKVISHAYLTLLDLAPTFYEIARVEYPQQYGSDKISPLLGESMLSLISGDAEEVHDDSYVTILEHNGRAYVRKGPWKLVQIDRPFQEEDFLLFNVVDDLGETNDLKAEFPEKFLELLDLYRDYAARVKVIPAE
ncbi:MAG: arylsulfatase [Flavobacteriaceae bacterium]|jgi:arylsulfatase|nr:MAG: arylsulfatase [Flavobacteriaceae bacterium]